MRKSSGVPPPVCKVPGCGRKVRSTGLCQTHYKHRKTDAARIIKHQRPARDIAVKLNGLRVTPDCKEKVVRHAGERGMAINATLTDILEAWAKRYWARHKLPRKPGE